MKDFTFADETLDLNRSKSYKLSIQVQLDGFSFSIFDTIRNKHILLKHYNLSNHPTLEEKGKKIEEILKKDKHLKNPFKKNSCLIVEPKSTFIPSKLFDEKHLKNYLDFTFPLNDLDEIHYTQVDQLDAYNVFTIPNPISNPLISKFKSIDFYHYSFPLLFYHTYFIHSESTHIGLSIYDDFIEVLAINKEQELIFSNTYLYKSNADILYYLLAVYKQLELDTSQNDLFISGVNPIENPQIQYLKNYIKKVHPLKAPKEFTYSYTFKKSVIHHYTNLFRLNLCV
jgi:hypothetical protein